MNTASFLSANLLLSLCFTLSILCYFYRNSTEANPFINDMIQQLFGRDGKASDNIQFWGLKNFAKPYKDGNEEPYKQYKRNKLTKFLFKMQKKKRK